MAGTQPTADNALQCKVAEDASVATSNQHREEPKESENPEDSAEQMQLEGIEDNNQEQPEVQPQELGAGSQKSEPSTDPEGQHMLIKEEPKMPAKPSSRPAKYTRRRIVTVLVGKQKEPYHIHMDLLRSRVPYFAASLKECWNNNKVPKETTLEDADPADFDAVVHWIYEQKLPTYRLDRSSEGGSEDDSDDESTGVFVSFGRLPSIYGLANFLMMHDLQDALLDADLEDLRKNETSYRLVGIAQIFDLQLTSTPLYEVALRSYCERTVKREVLTESFKADVRGTNVDSHALKDIFLLCEELRRMTWTRLAEEKDKCKYHIHPDGMKCAQE